MTPYAFFNPERQPMTRREMLLRALASGSAALMLSAGPSAAGQQAPEDAQPTLSEPRAGGLLRIAKPDDIIVAGVPHLITPGNFPLYNLVYDTLVSYDEGLNPQPRLASSWTWSADYRELTLHLRPGVTFHTGRPFTSEDVRFNLERVADPSAGSQWLNLASLMHITTPTPDTVVIGYDAPARSTFDALAFTAMADHQTIGQTAASPHFVGTGPFRVQDWAPGDHLTVVANRAYWQPGRPYLEQVELHVVPDRGAAVVMLESGAVDWLSGVPGQDAQRLQADPAYQVLPAGRGATFYYLGMDVQAPPLADKRVRQAFGYALNRQRLIDIALFGFGRPASIPWPQQSLAYDGTLDQTYAYDPARARELLDSAGWDPNTVVPLSVPTSVAVSQQMAEVVQADLAAIGVKVAVQPLNPPAFVASMQRAQFNGAWIINMSFMNLSPATFFATAFAVRVPNGSNFASQQYQDLISQTFVAVDDHSLQQGLNDLTRILLDEAFVLPIADSAGQQTGLDVATARVRDIAWDRLGGFAYRDMWLA